MKSEYRNRSSIETQKRAIELYKKGFSFSRIAAEIGFTKNSISNWLKKHGVKVEPKSKIVQCSVCGKNISVFPKDIKSNKTGNFFCSKKHFQKWNKKAAKERFTGKNNPKYVQKIKTKCANCGEKMEVFPSRIPETGNVYCDSKCQYNGMSKHFSGELSPNWLGGIASAPYCHVWLDSDFKEDIKLRDEHKCQNPDCRKNTDRLSIHHIDYDKMNCHPDNLITLCFSCNARANFDREWHKSWYNAFMQRSNKTINSLTKERI